jgi:molybdopterin molybdotransferase
MTRHFCAQTSVADATAWIDEHVTRLGAEEILLAEADGRVLAQSTEAAVDLPPVDRATVDGLAVRAEETAGASTYNPLAFRLTEKGAALPPCAGILLSAGDPLPGDVDAVIALQNVQLHPIGGGEVTEPVPPGTGIERRGSHFERSTTLLEAGRRLLPHHIGLLAAAGVVRASVIRRPRVRCFLVRWNIAELSGSPAETPHDANGLLLRALVQRDGGTVAELRQVERDCAAIRAALAVPESDVIIVAGGTGRGSRDASAAALAEAGSLAIHGVALHPGESAGFGRNNIGVPVFLLPGTPTACLWVYEFFAGRAIRRLAGLNAELPFRRREMTTVRKIVSAIGITEICPVRCLGHDQVMPIASFGEAGLGAVARADGFVVISDRSEGVPEGGLVKVYLQEETDRSTD